MCDVVLHREFCKIKIKNVASHIAYVKCTSNRFATYDAHAFFLNLQDLMIPTTW